MLLTLVGTGERFVVGNLVLVMVVVDVEVEEVEAGIEAATLLAFVVPDEVMDIGRCCCCCCL